MTTRLAFVAMLCVAVMGCDRSITRHRERAEVFRAFLLSATPIGSSIDSAQVLMEANGFRCEAMRNDTFAGLASGIRTDFLYCDKERGAGFLTARRWQTAHVDTAGRVRAVFATTGLIAP